MRTIATTVGVSLYENYLKGKRDIEDHYKALRDEPASKYEEKADRIKMLRKPLREFLNKSPLDASAETKSVHKISDKLRGEINVQLIATDTILSVVAAELLAETGCGGNIESHFNREQDAIRGLQVADAKTFKEEGSKNLLSRLYRLLEEYGGMMSINMTGGFKATIPLLTVFGQVNDVPLYYIFENTDTLIEIPRAPLDIDWAVFKEHAALLSKLEREDVAEIKDGDLLKKHPELEAVLETSDGLVSMSALGMILWRRYRSRCEIVLFSPHAKSKRDRLEERRENALGKACCGLKAKLLARSTDSDLRHPLKNCDLPSGFHCYKTMIDDQQARVIWSSDERETQYGGTEIDLYIASFYIGKDVHNADTEYVKQINSLIRSKYGEAFEKERFIPVTFDKEARNTTREVAYV